ncbi:MAG: hypothetical protein ACREHE_03775 [Rhizomicrobium sp.]
MGFVSLKEDIEEALLAASIMSERLRAGTTIISDIDKIVNALLKRCAYVQATMKDIQRLHSDLSHDTRNRIYTLRCERDEAVRRIAELEEALAVERRQGSARLRMASKKIREQKQQKPQPRSKKSKTIRSFRRI